MNGPVATASDKLVEAIAIDDCAHSAHLNSRPRQVLVEEVDSRVTRPLDIQSSFLASLSDTVEKGISSLVDADLAKESAKLQSLQVKQQLGAQALSIANKSPEVILSLFR